MWDSIKKLLRLHILFGLGTFAIFRTMSFLQLLRGSAGSKPSQTIDYLFRLAFLSSLFAPAMTVFPKTRAYLFGLLGFYLPFFLDRSEFDGSRTNHWFKQLSFWKSLAQSHKLKLVKTAELPSDKRYIFALHPHAILPYGGALNLLTSANDFKTSFPGIDIRGAVASFCFYIPVYRDVFLSLGMCDVSRFSVKDLLEQHKFSVMLVPGGAREALLSASDGIAVFLRDRKGFVRLALETGSPLVPVLSFGEAQRFKTMKGSHSVLDWLQNQIRLTYGITLPLLLPSLPSLHHPIVTVVGAPIETGEKIAQPTEEQVDALHAQYMSAIQSLYERYQPEYLPDGPTELAIH